MGNISIIARRLADGHVQYGWSGNSGYFSIVGERILEWYQSPDSVEYLFGLGQLEWIGKPGSEKNTESLFNTHKCAGIPHHLGLTEREIFSKIIFIDYGYFYDIDQQWYYIIPGPFRIKMPFSMVAQNLDERGYEWSFRDLVEMRLTEYILTEYGKCDPDFVKIFEQYNIDKDKLSSYILNDKDPIHRLFENKIIFNYFDDWAVVIPDKDGKAPESFKLMKKQDKHIETIYW